MSKRIFWGSALLLVGLLLLASNFGYLAPFSIWSLWPILVIWPALRVTFGRVCFVVGDRHWRGRSSFVGEIRYGRRPWEFKSPMAVDLWAGDVDIDLTTATFQPGPNYLYVHAWAGDIDIAVPRDMKVSVEASCSAGDLELLGRHRSGLGVSLKAEEPVGWDTKAGAKGAASAGAEAGAQASEAGAKASETASGTAAGEGPAGTESTLFIRVDVTFGDVKVG